MAWNPVGNLKGPQGDQGVRGDAGSTLLNGTAVPNSAAGVLGDYYINTANGDLYFKTAAATWTLKVNLKGPQGNPGTNGADGSKFFSAPGLPGPNFPSTANAGDFYINATTGNYYSANGTRPNLTWSSLGSLKGATGANGADGANIAVWSGTASQYTSVDKNAYDLYLVKG